MDRAVVLKECWNQAVNSFGTAYIFEQRANRHRRYLRLLTFLGMIVPAIIGSIVLSFGINAPVLPLLISVASILIPAQFFFSVWSLVSKWDDTLAYSTKSNSTNKNLSLRYRELARTPPEDDASLNQRVQFLQAEYQWQSRDDEVQGVTEKEKRMGMRAGLREFQRPCATCEKVPSSMKSTECPTCGQF